MLIKSNKKKEELIHILQEAELQATRLEELGRDVVQSARFTKDIVSPIRIIVSQIPSNALSLDQWERQIESWRTLQACASELEASQETINSFKAVSFASTSTSSEVVMMSAPSLRLSPLAQAEMEGAKLQLLQTFQRFPLIDSTRSSMRRLRLDVRRGNGKTPLELLDDAHGALESPISQKDGPISILITLRECINSTINDLLRQRPTQERTKNVHEKLISLGHQCARPKLLEPHFDRLANDAKTLLDQLSGSKQAYFSRQQLIDFFNRGLIFLNALLESIDEDRLRST